MQRSCPPRTDPATETFTVYGGHIAKVRFPIFSSCFALVRKEREHAGLRRWHQGPGMQINPVTCLDVSRVTEKWAGEVRQEISTSRLATIYPESRKACEKDANRPSSASELQLCGVHLHRVERAFRMDRPMGTDRTFPVSSAVARPFPSPRVKITSRIRSDGAASRGGSKPA